MPLLRNLPPPDSCSFFARQLALLRPFLDEAALAARGIGHAMNLGMYDFFPSLAGKGPSVRFLQDKWGLKRDECIALFDDDNDIKMVQEVTPALLCLPVVEVVESRHAAVRLVSVCPHSP